MKVFAGARGSGKTYNLVHAALEDEKGVFVTESPEMRDCTEEEYPELAGRIVSREQIAGVSAMARLYIDGIKSGEDLSWADKWPIGGLAVSPMGAVSGRLSAAEIEKYLK